MKRSLACFALLLASASVTGASSALAGPATTFIVVDHAASDQADELLKRGLTLAKADRWAEAEPLMRQAWELKRSYDIAGNLGIVEAAQSEWRDAAEHLTYAFKTFPANGKPELKQLLEQMLAKVLPQVAAVTITVSPDKAEVLVDGKSVGTAPLADAVFVDPGTRTVEAKLVGYETATATVDAAKGSAREVALTMKKVVVIQPPTPPVKDGGWPRRKVAPGAVLGGAAGAALVVGVVLEAVSASKRSTTQSVSESIQSEHHSCVMGAKNYDPRCPQLIDTAHSSDALHDAGVGVLVGAAAAAAGTVAYFLWPASAQGRTSGLRAAPLISTTSAGVLVSGAF